MADTSAKPVTIPVPRVQTYRDYREFLRDLYQHRKGQSARYSWLQFAADLGFAPTNVIRLAVAGKRKLSRKSAATIASALGLKFEERRYFLNLVTYTDSPGFRRKQEAFDALLAAKREAMTHMSQEQMGYFSKWYHPVVRECLALSGGAADAREIAARLYQRLTIDQVDESFRLLESLGLIVRNSAGRFEVVPGHRVVLPEDEVAGDLTILEYHKQMSEAAVRGLDVVPQEDREFNALTVRLSHAGFEALRKKLVEVCMEALRLEEENHPHSVVAQLNVQLCALTKGR